MSRMTGSVLLVGSVPADTAAEALRTCGEGVGSSVTCLPDGETGYRRLWIQFLAATIYHGHPALETVQRPKPLGGTERWFFEEYGEEGWLFKPLKTLEIGDAKLYLGLVHHTDGVEGSLRRVGIARQYLLGFGVATECGLGRRPKGTIPELLRIHCEVAAAGIPIHL